VRAILSAAGCARARLAFEAADRFLLGIVRLEHRQQLRDGQQILMRLVRFSSFSLPP
jgi:hypothetical protein